MDNRKRSDGKSDKGYKERLSKVFYYIFLALWASIVIVKWVLQTYALNLTQIIPYSCFVRSLFEIYCPGCGGTRALESFLKGDLWQSLIYHPLVPVVGFFSLFYLISNTLSLITKGRVKTMTFRDSYLFIVLGILLLQWLVKNILKIVCGIEVC